MGCVHSKKDKNDVHPNVFRVINIDEQHNGLWTGQLEVTDQELVLYRRGRDPTKWPLRSLRRYGYDGEIFSFESGRRCTTGEGIYAFKCRRAEQLFTTLQRYIQVRNLAAESLPLNFAANIPSAWPQSSNVTRQSVEVVHGENVRQSINESELPSHLRSASQIIQNTNHRLNSTARMNSFGNGSMNPDIHNITSSQPSSNILEGMSLNPLQDNSLNQVTNLYQLREFPLQREHNNNQKTLHSDQRQHSYCNDINADLKLLRQTLRKAREEETSPDEIPIRQFVVQSSPPTSPTLSANSEHYAVLATEQEAKTLYMNIAKENKKRNGSIKSELQNRLISAFSSANSESDVHCADESVRNSYANVGSLGEGTSYSISRSGKVLGRALSEDQEVFAQSPLSITSTDINYALLDIESKGLPKGSVIGLSQSAPRNSKFIPVAVVAQEHTAKLSTMTLSSGLGGYTTIDFNKTNALLSVVSGGEADTDGSRRTRHNSTVLPSSTGAP